MLVAVALTAAVPLFGASVARAHEGLASSTPRSGSVIEAPISEVTLEFLGDVADVPQLTLLDPDENTVPSVTTRVSSTTFRLEFDPVTRKGAYIVQYVAELDGDDHLTLGAIEFRYGAAGSGIGAGTVIVFVVVSSTILGVGIWFGLRQRRRLAAGQTSS